MSGDIKPVPGASAKTEDEPSIYPYVDAIITVYHNDTWAETFQFDLDGVDNLDSAVAALVRITQLKGPARDKTKITK